MESAENSSFTEHVISVRDTGCVDNDYYPIYDSSNDSYTNCNNNDRMDIDIDEEKQYITFLNLTTRIHDQYENHLLLKSEILTSKEKANCTILFNAAKELQIGDEIQFKLNYIYHPNNNQSMKPKEGRGIIVDHNYYSSQYTVSRLMDSNNNNNNNNIIIDCYQYNIIRLKSETKSKLFKIITASEQDLFTEFLSKILQNEPISILNEISSFLYNKYQRNIYYDCKSFEKLVESKYDKSNDEKSCTLCTMLNPLESKQCIICNHPFNDNNNNNDNNHWLGTDSCYEDDIYNIFKGERLEFPVGNERHEMYAESPFLPIICRSERINLNIIENELKNGLSDNVNLYKYQLYTVLWCYIREKSILLKQKLCIGGNDYLFTNRVKCGVYNINNNFIPANISRIIPQRLLTYKGGIIGDDVGLGKSLTMLSLIMVHSILNIKNINDINDIEYGANKETIRSSATLLIAPSHLINQWKHEINKHFKKNIFKILIITTSSEHNKISYKDILSAQIVLVSSQFLGGTHYKFMRMDPNNYIMTKHRNCLNLKQLKGSNYRSSRLRSLRSRSLNTKNGDLNIKNIFFELIYFRRIILDEAPDYLCNDEIRDVLFSINSDFKWYVSATPFPNDESIGYAADFLDIQFEKECDYIDWNENINKSMGNILHCIIYNHLFSRHTKESILDDNYLPNIQETVQYADFHPIEKLFYDIIKSRRGTKKENKNLERKICSGILNEFERDKIIHCNWYNRNYLNELLKINREYYPLKIIEIESNLKSEQKNLKKLKKNEKELEIKKKEFEDKGIEFTLIGAYPLQRERYKYHGIKQKVKTSKRRINEMELEIIRNKKENEMIKNNVINKEIIKFEDGFNHKIDGKILLEIVKKYGIKQAVLLEFIKKLIMDDVNNRIIIFSLFGSTLDQIKNRLSLIGVYAVLCRGNVHSRKKALASFQDTDNNDDGADKRVILLSVSNAASGANLNRATHVILVDAVPGTSSEAFAKERQAVGRAVRQGMKQENCTKVIRFVICDTIEQETFERNEKLRKESNNNNNNIKIKYDLNKSLKIKRRESEIDFYIKINQNKRKKRKREKIINDNDENKDEEEIINEPPKKRRRN